LLLGRRGDVLRALEGLLGGDGGLLGAGGDLGDALDDLDRIQANLLELRVILSPFSASLSTVLAEEPMPSAITLTSC
jgi:hypothetical protein